MRVQATRPRPRFDLTTDGDGVVGHAGAALLAELADRLGLAAALGWQADRGWTAGTTIRLRQFCATWP